MKGVGIRSVCMRPKIKGAREALLNEGRKILINKGYKQLKIQDVTRSAGVSAGTFYSYFDDKRSFAMTIIEEGWEAVVAKTDEIVASKDSLYDKLKAIYMNIEEFESSYHSSLLQTSHDCEPDYFSEFYEGDTDKLRVKVDDILSEAIEKGEVKASIVKKQGITSTIVFNMINNVRAKVLNFDDFYAVLMMVIGIDSDDPSYSRDEHWMQRILDTTQTKIFWKDDKRRFIGVNKAFLDYYNFKSEEELIGKTDEEIGWHSDPDPFKNDEIQVLSGACTHRVHGKCIARGEERDILASKSPMYENGKIIGLVGSFDDVTVEYKQRNEIGRLNRVLDAIPGGIAVYKRRFDEFYSISLNDHLVSMLGGKREDYIGKSIAELSSVLHPDDRERMFEDSARIHKSGHSTSGVYRFFNRDKGEYKWLQIDGNFVRLPNDEEFAYYNYIDVDELERAKSAEEVAKRLYGYAVNAANLFLWAYDVKNRVITFDDNEYTTKSRNRLGLPEVIENAPDYLLKYVLPEDRDTFIKMFFDIDEGNRSSMCEIRFRPLPERRMVYLRLSLTAETDKDGNAVIGYGMTQDITREKLSAEEYAREESFIRVDNEAGYVAKGHYNLTQNKVVEYWRFWDTAMDISTDYKYDDVLAALMAYVAFDDDKARISEMFDRENLLYRYETGQDSVSWEYRRSEGIYAATWVNMELRMFENPMTGDIECFIYMYDVTEKYLRHQTAANLREMGYKFIGLIDTVDKSATYFSFSEDYDGMNVYLNSKDYDKDIAESIKDFMEKSEVSSVLAAVDIDEIVDQLENKNSYAFLCDAHSSDGERMRISSNYRYLDEKKRIVYNAIQDVTKQYLAEQKQMEQLNAAMKEADKANEMKSQFLSSVSHDMRTPLNAVLGYDRLALATDDIHAKNQYLKKIASAGDTLLSLINDTLDLQKIESDAIELKPEIVSRKRIVNDIMNSIEPLMEEKNIEFVLDDSRGIKATVYTDVTRVEKILINLLANAIKFTPEGGRVDFVIECIEENDDRILDKITVRDTGVGMSKEFLPRVFEPFTQERTEETANIGGTGLGLSIVKSLVQKMGGSIEVQSEIGKGSKFVVFLPLERVAEIEDEIISVSIDESAIDFTGIKVLLVEDNAMNAEIAESILTMKGASIETASNGKTGVEMFEDAPEGTYDIILMDIRMPVMDGYEATMNIRNSGRADSRSIPIIAMTADAYEEDVEKTKKWGMDGHIAKPIDPQKLFVLISSLLRKVNK